MGIFYYSRGKFKIPESKKLIIVDAHDTILKRDFSRSKDNILHDPSDKEKVEWALRDGFLNFIEYYAGIEKKKMVISSDGRKEKLTEICTRFGIIRYLEHIYGREHLDRETYLKKLDKILEEQGVDAEDAVFIGDGQIDRYSAEKYGVDFIQVPNTKDSRHFSFNFFLHVDFTQDSYGLELQKITNLKKIYHNYSSPVLIEEALKRGEGRLAHLGALVVDTQDQLGEQLGAYIVDEPSSNQKVYWGGPYKPFPMEKFQLLYLRLLAFLQDREIFIQDCYTGADPEHHIPLRVMTQTAWHNLFARNMLIQATPEQMESFFPEYTIIHLPNFKAIPEVDGTDGEDFVLINLLKKLVLVGGTDSPDKIRRAVFALQSHALPQEDIIPIRCSSNKGNHNDLSLFFGEGMRKKSLIALDSRRHFFGDDGHGWSNEGVYNMEWGCYASVYHFKEHDSNNIYHAIRKFSTILENVDLNETRRVDLSGRGTTSLARASFPISHLESSDKSGIADHPDNVFVIVHDAMGILPALAKLNSKQLIFYLLMGYHAQIPKDGQGWGAYPKLSFAPFFKDQPFVFPPENYASLLWEKLERSGAKCWLINSSHLGAYWENPTWLDQKLLKLIVDEVHHGNINEDDLVFDEDWGFSMLKSFKQDSEVNLIPEIAWGDQTQYASWKKDLMRRLAGHFRIHEPNVTRHLMDGIPPGVKSAMEVNPFVEEEED